MGIEIYFGTVYEPIEKQEPINTLLDAILTEKYANSKATLIEVAKKYANSKATLIEVAKKLSVDTSQVRKVGISYFGVGKITDENVLVINNDQSNFCWLRANTYFTTFYLHFFDYKILLDINNPSIDEIVKFVKEHTT